MVRLTLHSTIAPPCSTAPHSSLMSVILNGYGDIQLNKVPDRHFQIEVHARPCHRGQPDSRFPQGLGSALYPKKSASFTAFFSFSSSYRGSVVKNSSGMPVAMAAITQEYR